MSNIKEQIRQEIEKWIYNTDEWEVSPGKYNKSESEVYKVGWRCGLGHIREFIDSLPEVKPSRDLEEEVKRYYSDNFTYISSDQPTLSILTNVARHFAEWQKEQMLKDAEEDALLLERAWLTLDGFGHEELAGRLRQFAERKGLTWK